MRIALIADTFPPLRTSGAVQLRDLSREFVRQGHELTVMLPSVELAHPWTIEHIDGVTVLRLRAARMKNVGYIRRTFAECSMPFFMIRSLRKTPLASTKWGGVIFYAPSIFHGPLVSRLKKQSGCKSYLVIRDIFPEWAADLGLMGRGLPYKFFNWVAQYQYSVADTIGIQTDGNSGYFREWIGKPGRVLEVLPNWLGRSASLPCSIRLENTELAGRKVLVYAGNMGVAQGLDIILDLAERMSDRSDVGFLFVGRGTHASNLKKSAMRRNLNNVVFFDEIDPDEIPDLYRQCEIGIVSLDEGHKSHNIPGKFLTYIQSGLPVLASVNPGNDLAALIDIEDVGRVCESFQVDELVEHTNSLLAQSERDGQLPSRCKKLFERAFSVDRTVKQIVSALSK